MADERRSDDERTRQIAREAATQAVRETLRSIGIDVDDPMEAQRDAALLRTLRKAKDRGVVIFLTTIAMSVIWAGWEWAKSAIRIGGGPG